MRRLVVLSSILAILAPFVPGQQAAQPNAVIFSTSYQPHWPIDVNISPGQVLPLAVHGLGLQLERDVKAGGYPLPTELAGVSVRYGQLNDSKPIPILGIRRAYTSLWSTSASGGPDSSFVVITVQIPFEIFVGPFDQARYQFLLIYENGVLIGAASVLPSTAEPHVAGAGDTVSWVFPAIQGRSDLPLVQHADGPQVTMDNPAGPGEVLALYAYGLGLSERHPRPNTGEPSPAGYDMDLGISFEFGRNPKPAPIPRYQSNEQPPMDGLVFAGLAEGMAGVYVVRFKVPTIVPEGTPRCAPATPGTIDPGVVNNLMVNIGYTVLSPRPDRYDGAGICVAVPTTRTAVIDDPDAAR
ncbi:MAG: hypothetical protein IT165_02275 [Bryobacterales bacterium]|nr:hypothetical protein [Bryobacterales bacterium]